MITQKRLKELLNYDENTGVFTRRISISNNSLAGDVVGFDDGNGYIQIGVDGNQYRAHRLAWLYVKGEFTKKTIDHENHDRSDNKFNNLREASHSENCRNVSLSINNKSGFIGVTWDKERGKWYSSIRVNQKTKSLGRFVNLSDAVLVRIKAEEKYGFHLNHGIEKAAA